MTVTIAPVTSMPQIKRELAGTPAFSLEDRRAFDACLALTTALWSGYINDRLVAVWGLVPPTILSDRAYLWLFCTEEVEEHTFIFVRYSQLVIENLLTEWPTIVGHVLMTNDRAYRWLKWLGADFGPPVDGIIPFVIRKRNG